MSLEAMEWVWEHSRARGVARMVLLAIAYRAPSADCTAYAGTTMLTRRCSAARSSVQRAVDTLLASGELEVVEGATGPRGERCYRLPHAAAHVHEVPDSGGSGGPIVGEPVTPPAASSGPRPPRPRGSALGPQEPGDATGRGSSTGPPNQIARDEEISSAAPRANHDGTDASAPDGARALVAALTQAGLSVTWRLNPSEWATVCAAEQRWGRDALVRTAIERTAGRNVRSARYLLAIWRDADNFTNPNATAASPVTTVGQGAKVLPMRRAPGSTSDNLLAGLALLEAGDEGGAP